MQITIYNHPSVFDQIGSEWNALLDRSISNRVFSTREWLSSWWKAYQPGELWVLACHTLDGRLVGLAPWFIEQQPEQGRVVRSIGCIDVTDYLDIIIDRNCVGEVQESLAEFLVVHRNTYDALDLCNLPAASPTSTDFAASLEKRGFIVQIEQQEVCPIIQLPDTWDDYLAALSKKDRHELRRKVRRAENAQETIHWYIVNEDDNLMEEIDKFMALMAGSHPEKAAFLADEKNADFFQHMIPIAYEKGWLQLSFLTVDDKPAAGYLNFDYNNNILVYNSGLLPDQYGHLSPGIVLLAYLINHAIENEREAFDFLRGDETYKYRLGAHDTQLLMLTARYSAM